MTRTELITELTDLRDRALNEASILAETLALLRAGTPAELPAPAVPDYHAQQIRQCREQYLAECEGRAEQGEENRTWEEFVAAFYGRASALCPMHVLAAGPR